MFLIKRKKTKIVEENIAEVVVSNQDRIVLGAFCFTGMQQGNFFVKDTATINYAATIEGNVTAHDCDINGLVRGNVFCANNLWLGNSAVIEGSIMAKKAIMETGCKVNGTVVLTPKVEISSLAVRITEAEKIIVDKKITEVMKISNEEMIMPQKSTSILDTKILAEESSKQNVHKLELSLEQSAVGNDNWW